MKTTRYTMDVDRETDKVLSDLSESKSVTKAEVVRRALATYAYLSKKKEGEKVSITDEKDRVVKDIVMP